MDGDQPTSLNKIWLDWKQFSRAPSPQEMIQVHLKYWLHRCSSWAGYGLVWKQVPQNLMRHHIGSIEMCVIFLGGIPHFQTYSDMIICPIEWGFSIWSPSTILEEYPKCPILWLIYFPSGLVDTFLPCPRPVEELKCLPGQAGSWARMAGENDGFMMVLWWIYILWWIMMVVYDYLWGFIWNSDVFFRIYDSLLGISTTNRIWPMRSSATILPEFCQHLIAKKAMTGRYWWASFKRKGGSR